MRIKFLTLSFLLCFLISYNANCQDVASVTVMSYNVRTATAFDGTNSWQYRFPASIKMIEDQKPDVIGLQEAWDYQVADILDYVKNYKGVGKGREDGKHNGEQTAILYNKKKVKLIKWGNFWLSQTPKSPSKGWDAVCPRTATWCLFKDKNSGNKFYVVNTHLDHSGTEAQKQGLELILAKIHEMNKNSYPFIVMGDFNVHPDNPVLDVINNQMNSAQQKAYQTDKSGTFNNWGKAKPEPIIDYIYYSGFSSCPLFEVVRKPYFNKQYISDHYPIKAILAF